MSSFFSLSSHLKAKSVDPKIYSPPLITIENLLTPTEQSALRRVECLPKAIETESRVPLEESVLASRSLRRVPKRKASNTSMRNSNNKACRLLFKRPSSRKRKRIWRLDLFLETFPRLSKLLWELTVSCQFARKSRDVLDVMRQST